jgi:hypothetical protein
LRASVRHADAFSGMPLTLLRPDCPEGEEGQAAKVGACTAHGAECACVIYGGLVEHFRWADHDPGALAEELLHPVFSRPDECER